MSRPAFPGVKNGGCCLRAAKFPEEGDGMHVWLREAPTAVLQRAEDLAVELAQRHFEADRLRDALKQYRIAQVFGAELTRRSER